MSTDHILLYSHGFAVDKESRGLFTDVAASMPTLRHEFVDLNIVHDRERLIRVRPMHEQVAIFKRRLDALLASLPAGGRLDIVCHSLGCVVAALAAGGGVRRVILIAPPSDIGAERTKSIFKDHPRVSIKMDADSVFARKDGVVATVPPEYWPSLKGISPGLLYQQLAGVTDLHIITAAQDEQRDFGQGIFRVAGAHEYELDGNHNFTHAHRGALVTKIRSLLLQHL